MTFLDIQFWLLAALLGGCVWAIEAGLSRRHRTVLLSSMASTLLSMLILMFYVDDNTKLVPLEAEKFAKKKGGPAVEKEAEEDEGGGNGEGGGGGGGGSGNRNGNGNQREGASNGGRSNSRDSAAGQGDQNSVAGGTSKVDDSGIEYSRAPFKDCPTCPDMIIVPRGVASVGAAGDDPARQPNERPSATVPMPRPLAVGRLEILRSEFAAFAAETGFVSTAQCNVGPRRRGTFNWERPGFEQDERHPVVCVTWPEVRLYLAWLSEKSGRTYRLPTEVEWEHAARAGTDTPYAMGRTVTRYTANIGRSRDGTTVGGLFAQNQWGLSDFTGNVWEMTSQCAYDHTDLDKQNNGQAECRRVIKGGAWSAGPVQARHAARAFIGESTATNDIGFRVVRDVDERDDHRILTAEQKKRLAEDAKVEAQMAEQARLAAEEAARKRIEDAEKAAQKAAADKAAKDAQKK